MDGHERKRILERVRRNEISPEEGLRLIRGLVGAGDVARVKHRATKAVAASNIQAMDIAVIGMAGRFPGARNLDEFWEKLANGVDCVTEIPPERWDVEQFYSPDSKERNKTYCRWSGMIQDADRFDPLFFNISPKEAQLMDPQQRLFLEESWRAIEDAGYSPQALSGKRCGVFAGVMQGDYAQALRAEVHSLDAQFIAGSGNCFLPARVSYFLNLTGPCMAVDTACSSSLVAIHQACQAIVTGEIEIALAGGVSVIATPYHHITSAKSEMLSRGGRCKSFDNAADGFVPSEGVGVVVLKSLQRAQADGDHVYGVIKGGRVNQDGRTNGITAPSANSQTRLVTEIYNTYGINPENISYVEAHGTGTKLGDPIELTALTRAFRQFSAKTNFCAIGSVKSNIGHALAAAGVGGLIKVLLSMKYGRLPPSLHFRHANEHIDFDNSPFFVNTALRDWPRGERPRLAAVSSFGLSGTNCHLVVAEAPERVPLQRIGLPAGLLVVLSARTETALARCIENLQGWTEREGDRHVLADVAYTLATGRSHFKVRLAFIVKDIAELRQTLFTLEAGDTPDNSWRGTLGSRSLQSGSSRATEARDIVQTLAESSSGDLKMVDTWLARLGQLYAEGADIDWHKLYAEYGVQRISLPAYSFERERYWLAEPSVLEQASMPTAPQPHPLLHENVSTLREQRFATRFHGSEFFLTDHMVKGRKVLPGVCFLVMARVAGEIAGECAVGVLRDVAWLKPLVVDERPIDVMICLFPANDCIGFEVVHAVDGERVVIARGWVDQMTTSELFGEHLDIAAITARCGSMYDSETLYRQFREAGLVYGHSFRLIEQLFCGDGEALARLGVTDHAQAAQGSFLHDLPLLDAALQTVAGIAGQLSGHGDRHYLPFSLGRLEWLGALPMQGYAYARLASQNDDTWLFDVTLTDEAGHVAMRCRDFAVRRAVKNALQGSQGDALLDMLQRLESGELEVDEAEVLLHKSPTPNEVDSVTEIFFDLAER